MVGVLRTVKSLEFTDKHRRQAKVIIDSCFESNFHYTQYDSAAPGTERVEDLIIDAREEGSDDDLKGNLDIIVSEDDFVLSHGVEFPAKSIQLKVSWEEPSEGPKDVTISKVITSLP